MFRLRVVVIVAVVMAMIVALAVAVTVTMTVMYPSALVASVTTVFPVLSALMMVGLVVVVASVSVRPSSLCTDNFGSFPLSIGSTLNCRHMALVEAINTLVTHH